MSTKKGRVGSTFQLSITFSILIGEFMNYLLVPSFDSDKCVPLSDFSWKMQIGFSAVFGLLLFITLLFGPNPKRRVKQWRVMNSWRKACGLLSFIICSGVRASLPRDT